MSRSIPSRIASPKGLVSLVPPRKRFHIWSAKSVACFSSVKVLPPVAPPIDNVTILPFCWQVLMSLARKLQSGSWLSPNGFCVTALQTCSSFRTHSRVRT